MINLREKNTGFESIMHLKIILQIQLRICCSINAFLPPIIIFLQVMSEQIKIK